MHSWPPCLPGCRDDVERLYQAGYFAAAERRIGALLAEDRLPPMAKAALQARAEQMRRLPENYPYTRAAALERLRREVPDFTEAEFDALVDSGHIDWRFIEGEPHYQERFAETLAIYPALNARGFAADPPSDLRARTVQQLRAAGRLQAEITLRLTLAPAQPAAPETPVQAWLPFPAACPSRAHIELLDATPGGTLASDDGAPAHDLLAGHGGGRPRFPSPSATASARSGMTWKRPPARPRSRTRPSAFWKRKRRTSNSRPGCATSARRSRRAAATRWPGRARSTTMSPATPATATSPPTSATIPSPTAAPETAGATAASWRCCSSRCAAWRAFRRAGRAALSVTPDHAGLPRTGRSST